MLDRDSKIVIGIFGVIVLLILLPIFAIQWLIYDTNPLKLIWLTTQACSGSASEHSQNAYRVSFVDEADSPISCTVVRVYEESSVCVSSPCPEYQPVFSGRTSRDGTLIVPKRAVSGSITAHTPDFDGTYEVSDGVSYAFDTRKHAYVRMEYEDFLSTVVNDGVTLKLQSGEDDGRVQDWLF